MLFDLPPDPPKFWLPPKPAIIRHATPDLYPKRQPLTKTRRRSGDSPMIVTLIGTYNGTRSSNTITYSGLPDTSAYPEVVAMLSWRRDSDGERGMNAITFGGNAGTLMAQQSNTSRQAAGGRITRFAGPWSGNIVSTMSGSTENDHRMTLVGLNKAITNVVQSSNNQDNSNAVSVSPSSPGPQGVRIAFYVSNSATMGVDWTNAVELSDVPSTNHSHTSAWDAGDDSSAMTATRAVTIAVAAMYISIN